MPTIVKRSMVPTEEDENIYRLWKEFISDVEGSEGAYVNKASMIHAASDATVTKEIKLEMIIHIRSW